LINALLFKAQISLPGFIKEGISRIYRSCTTTYARCILNTQAGSIRRSFIEDILREYKRWLIYITKKERESRKAWRKGS
jgi:hypothetical protein